MKTTRVTREAFDTINNGVEEGIYRAGVQSSPAREAVVLDLDLIRKFGGEDYDMVQEQLVIGGECTCAELDGVDWLVVEWVEDY